MGWVFPEDVPGWLTPAEGAALARLAKDQHVLEVGSFCGRSTVLLAQVAYRVVAVDHHEGDRHSGKGGTLPTFIGTLARYQADNVTPVIGAFDRIALYLRPGSFGLVYVDASHDETSVCHDVTAALRLVEPGGWIALHDWGWSSVKAGAARGHRLFTTAPAGVAGDLAWFTAPPANREVA